MNFQKIQEKKTVAQKVALFGLNIFSLASPQFYRTKVDKDTTQLISHQLESRKRIVEGSKLYGSDVQIVSIGDKLYYLPEWFKQTRRIYKFCKK